MVLRHSVAKLKALKWKLSDAMAHHLRTKPNELDTGVCGGAVMAKTNEAAEQRRSTIEEEIEALGLCLERIGSLDTDAQTRVVRYLKDRLGLYLGSD
jgi:hypothetical protein